ncbi:MAG: oligosaccharide repeat unit polymerase [Bacteroidetes bacterium]|nr:oligosaccharide repeat unit polymerase [Bacteroidota bacterium]
MLNHALLLVLIVEVIFFTYFDKKTYGNYYSPVVILSYPLLAIILLAFLFCAPLGFKPISTSLLLLCNFGLLVFWFGSFFWSVIIPARVLQRVSEKFEKPENLVSFKLKTSLQILAWLIIIFMLYSFMLTLQKYGSISASGSDGFTKEYGGQGIQGHVLGLAIPLLIFFIGISKKRDLFTIATIVFLVIVCFLYRVKNWLFIPILGGILIRFFYERKFRINPFKIIIFAILVLLLFVLSYAFTVRANENGLIFLLKHFMGYIYAGVLGFGEHINQNMPVGVDPKVLFMPFINIYNYVTGSEVTGVVSSYHVLIDKRGLEDVNVKTFFGTILIYGGYYIGVCYTLLLSIFFYFIWIVASLSKNYWMVVLYVFLATALALGWFDFYYNLLPFLELPIYMIILIILTNKKRKNFSENIFTS